MGTQVVTGVIRFQSKTGIWRMLRASEEEDEVENEDDEENDRRV
jgi:hypothetical protein